MMAFHKAFKGREFSHTLVYTHAVDCTYSSYNYGDTPLLVNHGNPLSVIRIL